MSDKGGIKKPQVSDSEKRKRIERAKRQRRRQRKANQLRLVITAVLIVVVIGCILGISSGIKKSKQKKIEAKARQEQQQKEAAEKSTKLQNALVEAEKLSKGYDYDGAIELLQAAQETNTQMKVAEKVAAYEALKEKLKEADVEKTPHVSFNTLVADPSITWNLSDDEADKVGTYNQKMTTINEFKAIIQQLYERGFVLVSIHDLVTETTDEKGNTTFTKGKIMLPEGKKPLVMSQDEVCYYFDMTGDGYASRMIVGADGRPTTEYLQEDESRTPGPYDLVPVLNEFIDEHPEFSYKGAKAILSFTGYNGVLGYRTDPELAKSAEEGNPYADEYGVFNVDEEIAAAQLVAEALKADGWELASHSYGNISYGSEFAKVKEDADKWQQTVANVIGPSDILIFPLGTDIGGWQEYAADNEKYEYLKKQGFRFFCNSDASEYWMQLRPEYVRQGRRNLDGYQMYQELHNAANKLSDLFNVQSVYDETRPATGLEGFNE